MSDTTKGVIAIVLACILWGVSGLFYNLIRHIPAFEIMAHRTIWSFVFFIMLLAAQRQIYILIQSLTTWRSLWILTVASVLVGINWLIFVYAVQTGRALEASLGYFVFPLISVALGRLVFSERLNPAQSFAVALATVAVVVLTWGLGVAPWIALSLSVSFAFYGMIKKSLAMSPVVSVTAEALLLLPFAAVVLWIYNADGQGAFAASWFDSLMLIASGPMTATPLVLFTYASRRVSLASVGLISYLNPSLQFFVAVLILSEPFGLWHAIAFALIWTSLALYSAASWRQANAVRSAS